MSGIHEESRGNLGEKTRGEKEKDVKTWEEVYIKSSIGRRNVLEPHF